MIASSRAFTIVVVVVLHLTPLLGQGLPDYVKLGVAKHNNADYLGAVDLYTRAIEVDGKDKVAYFNRATSYATMGMFQKALTDLDRVIALDPNYVRALTHRGEILAKIGDKQGACEDFHKAKETGDEIAASLFSQYCGNEPGIGENLKMKWPDEENWKIADSYDKSDVSMLTLIHSTETLENWTEIGTMIAIRKVRGMQVDSAMHLVYRKALLNSKDAKLTFIQKDEHAKYPWIIFTIESSSFTNEPKPESQIWYVVQGDDALYTNFFAVRNATFPEDLRTKWVEIFKMSEIVVNPTKK